MLQQDIDPVRIYESTIIACSSVDFGQDGDENVLETKSIFGYLDRTIKSISVGGETGVIDPLVNENYSLTIRDKITDQIQKRRVHFFSQVYPSILSQCSWEKEFFYGGLEIIRASRTTKEQLRQGVKRI